MLENRALLLRPWAADAAEKGLGGSRCRAILNPAGGQHVGQARLRWRSLLGWPVCPEITVVESLDESLLCTVSRNLVWPRAWHLRDADNGWVGTVYRRDLRYHTGRRLARIRPAATGGDAFINEEGREMAALRPVADGLQLTFADWLGVNPFMRMLLLGAALR